MKQRIGLLQSKLNEVKKTERFVLSPHVFSSKSWERFQLKLKQMFISDITLVKSYLKLFLEKIKPRGNEVALISREDVLLNAPLRNG